MDPKKKPNLLHRIEYFFFSIFATIFRVLPRDLSYSLGRILGFFTYNLLYRRRKIAYENLYLAFPDKPKSEIKKYCKQCFENLALGTVDMFRMDKYTTKDFNELVDFEGLENIEKAKSYEKGIIFITGHLGFWESGAFVFPNLNLDVDFVAKKIKNPLIDSYILKMRAKGGGSFIDKRNGLRKILKTLTDKRGIAILIDQHVNKLEAVKVPFFGREAYTSPIVVQLASKKQIPVVPIFCFRIKKNRLNIEIGEPIIFQGSAGAEDNIINTSIITKIIENAIRKHPGQWMWIHNRWRVKYEGNEKKPIDSLS